MHIYIPATISVIAYVLTEQISTIFNGHMPVAEMVAGAGLGGMYTTVLCLSVTIGMNSALSTLISQAYGTGDLPLCGVYMNRALIVATIAFIPITVLLLNAENFFIALNFDQRTARYS